ncbi:MAG: hypothetical protein NTZ18_01540 [Candidatus Komeilibacteria bacterium]|nr:hypothetical protein [Candidatus Komeilibacteria bacterium]
MRKVLPCITTTKNTWRQQLKDINRLKIKEVAVFLTMLDYAGRKEFYKKLKKSTIVSIPHLHIRNDFTPAEIDFFYQNYKTRQFNTHGNYLDNFRANPYFKKYFSLETTTWFTLEYLKQLNNHYCLDLAHYFSYRVHLIKWNIVKIIDQKIKQGILPLANHLSGFSKATQDTHFASNINYFDYLKRTPKKYLAKIMALELENSIPEQLEFIKYIKTLL